MASASVTHILNKSDYSKHRLVTLPSDPPQPLAPSSLRLQTKIIGLTTNNLTYARMGGVLGWWDVYPLPPNTPAPYNDRENCVRIAAWGYAEIVSSTVLSIPAGKTIYGFLPISTELWDVRVEETGLKDQIFVLNEYRQHLWKIYNRYTVCAPLAELENTHGRDFLGWDALMQGLFGTSYNLNTYGFAWKDEHRLHPGGTGEWTAEDANLDDATVVVLNASGKTGTSWAWNLRHNRPKEHQPRTIIGVGSPASKVTIEQSGLYDTVLLNSDAVAATELVEKSGTNRVLLFDFGAREGATASWHSTLSSCSVPYTFIMVGGEVKVADPDTVRENLTKLFSERIVVNAGLLREKGIEVAKDAYFEEIFRTWGALKKKGGMPGMTLKWEEGLQAWERGWEALCRDEVPASTGLVFRV